jgi:hypothetical protein
VIGTAVTFHYVSRAISVLLAERPLPGPEWLRRILRQAIGRGLGRALVRTASPGASLDLLAEAALPDDLSWAATSASVAGAFAGFGAASSLPKEVRALVVDDCVQGWAGEDPTLSRAWVDDAVRPLEPELPPLGSLTLLAAQAPHQVETSVVDAFRARRPTDGELVGAVAFGAFTAARRVGSWLAPAIRDAGAGAAQPADA